MFTSRAEYRLLLREDNADLRLTEIGHSIGLASTERLNQVTDKKTAISELLTFLQNQQITPTGAVNALLASLGSAPLKNHCPLAQILRRPEITLSQLRCFAPDLPHFSLDTDTQVELLIKYQGYVDRQIEIVQRFQKMEHVRVPEDFNYSEINGLSREVCEKLSRIKPRSLGQASRISGITPAAMSLLAVHMTRRRTA
jgi:tRNA uridine 5-carboxymethylaminomethyl modification enzyme